MAEKKRGSTKSKSSGKAKNSRSTASRTAAKAEQKKPIRREVGGIVCLFLSVLTLLGMFQVNAVFIDLSTSLFHGLMGAGFYVMPFVLFLDFVILVFHDGRPVRLRVFCSLLAALSVGVLAHLLGSKVVIPWEFSMVGELWRTGVAGTSGGLLAGFFAMLLEMIIHKIGAVILVIVILILTVLASFNMTVLSVIRAIRARPRPQYDPPVREHRDTAEVLVNHVAQKHVERVERRRSSVADFDLPVDEPPALKKQKEKKTAVKEPVRAKQEPEPVQEPVEKRDLFLESLDMPEVPKEPEPIVTEEPAVKPEPVVEEIPLVIPKAKKPEPTVSATPEPAAKTLPPLKLEELTVPPVEVPQKVKKEDALLEAAIIANQIETAAVEQQKIYAYPPVSLLQTGSGAAVDGSEEMRINAERLKDALISFKIKATIKDVIRGPSVTRYEVELDRGVMLNTITKRADDIALSLGAANVRISAIPDKISVVGIEVPNKTVSAVRIHDVIDSVEFNKSKSRISFAVGKDISGKCIIGDIAKFPHLLIAGTTGFRQICMHEQPDHFSAVQGQAGRGSADHGGPQNGRAGHLQRYSSSVDSRGYRSEEGRRRPAVGSYGDDEALSADGRCRCP